MDTFFKSIIETNCQSIAQKIAETAYIEKLKRPELGTIIEWEYKSINNNNQSSIITWIPIKVKNVPTTIPVSYANLQPTGLFFNECIVKKTAQYAGGLTFITKFAGKQIVKDISNGFCKDVQKHHNIHIPTNIIVTIQLWIGNIDAFFQVRAYNYTSKQRNIRR